MVLVYRPAVDIDLGLSVAMITPLLGSAQEDLAQADIAGGHIGRQERTLARNNDYLVSRLNLFVGQDQVGAALAVAEAVAGCSRKYIVGLHVLLRRAIRRRDQFLEGAHEDGHVVLGARDVFLKLAPGALLGLGVAGLVIKLLKLLQREFDALPSP